MTVTSRRRKPPAVSCGTLIIDSAGRILLCHVTGTSHWDIPKGLQDPGETTLQAAMRELWEETGLVFDEGWFEEIGHFEYRPDKSLHLYRLRLRQDFDSLGHLVCRSHFPHHVTGKDTPEVDGFCWASREEVRTMCWPRMAQRLLALEW